MRPPGQGSIIGEEHALSQMSASHRVETNQLQLPGLSVGAQVGGVCGHEPVSGGDRLADPRVQKDNRAQHAGCGCTFSSLKEPVRVRIYRLIDCAEFSKDLDLPGG